MCTVTYLPLSNKGFILTSNRDEQKTRITLPPKKYLEDGIDLVYPKDKLAGGTWIGTSSKKRLICVLNGAFEKHKRKTSYKKSRGVIAKEILKVDNLSTYIENLNLEDIEPFTAVIVEWCDENLSLFELVWDDDKKHFSKLKNEPKIWSSSTLYTKEIRKVRKDWFQQWADLNDFSRESILQFHHLEDGDREQSILMKRAYVETLSITSVKKEGAEVDMRYEDLIGNKITGLSLCGSK